MNSRTITAIRAAAVVILFLLFCYPFIFLPFGTDQGIFAYIGTIINKGGVPYRDAWDIKPPVIYYLYSLGLRVFGHSMIGIRCFDLLYFSVTMFAMHRLGTLLFDKRVGVCAGVVLGVLYFFTTDFWSFSQCESFMILPMVLSVYLCCSGNKKKNPVMMLGSGALLGIVVMTKLTGFALAIPVVLYMVCEAWPAGKIDVRLLAVRFAVFGAGFLLSTGSIFFWFYLHGALSELYYTQFVYAREYSRSAAGITADYVHLTFSGFMRRYLFVLIPAVLSLLVSGSRGWRSETILTYSWFFSAILGFAVQGRFYHYHIVPVIAPLSLMGARGLLDLWSAPVWQKKLVHIRKKFIVIPVIIIMLLAAVWPHLLLTCKFSASAIEKGLTRGVYDYLLVARGVLAYGTTMDAARYIKEHTAPDDFVFIWGFQPLLHFLSERRAPTRFFFNAPLIASFNPLLHEWRNEAIADIREKQPRYIIVADNDALANILTASVNNDSRSILKGFPELEKILEEQYMPEKKIDNLLLYRRIGE